MMVVQCLCFLDMGNSSGLVGWLFCRCSVKIVPILVGNCTTETEAMYGRLLAKYIDDPSNIFSVSSDFCHWGQRYACIVLSWAKPPNLYLCTNHSFTKRILACASVVQKWYAVIRRSVHIAGSATLIMTRSVAQSISRLKPWIRRA